MDEKERETQKQKLFALGVHDLRNLARSVGILHPTMKKKDELITELLEVISGEKESVAPSNRGRKTSIKLTNESAVFLPHDLQELDVFRKKNVQTTSSRDLEFHQPRENTFVSYSDKFGYLRKKGNEHFFVDETEDVIVYVPKNFIEQFNLLIGDKIKAIAGTTNQTFYVVSEILSVNGNTNFANNRLLENFHSVKILANPITAGEIIEGESIHIASATDNLFLKNYVKALQTFKKAGAKIVLLASSMQVMELEKIKQFFDAEFFVTLIEQEPLYASENIDNCLNNVTMRAQSGEKIVLFVLNLDDIVRDLDLFGISQGEEFFKHCFSSMKIYRAILGLNRSLSNGGSITTILSTHNSDFSI